MIESSARPVTELPRNLPIGAARKTAAAVRRLRANFVFGALLVLFAGLVGRLLTLQAVEGSYYRGLVAKQERKVAIGALRGAVTDRHDRVLAHSRPIRNVRAEAGYRVSRERADIGEWVIPDVARFAATLSDVLEGWPSVADLRGKIELARMSPDLHRNRGRAVLTIRSNVDDLRLISRLDDSAPGLRGLILEYADRRDYPNGSWAGHVVGRASTADASRPLKGVDGVESALNLELSGARGSRRVRVDGTGSPFLSRETEGDGEGEGQSVRLAIDMVIQGYCEEALDRLTAEWKPTGAVAIVIDPANGDVLAMAVRPVYDPTDPRAVQGINYAVQGRIEVGSTFKPFTVCRALTRGVVRPDERFDMPHRREFVCGKTSKTVNDAHDAGTLGETGGTVYDLIAQSSNTGAAELANRLGHDDMRELLNDLEIMKRYGIRGIAPGGELQGRYPQPGDPHPWGPTDHLVVGFGHSMTMTPLRLACSFAAFARDDFTPVRPRLVLAVGDVEVPAGAPYPTLCPSPAHREVVRRALRGVVTEGTGSKTVQSSKYAIAGKTGTAKMPDASGPDRYYSASFVGYAPADAPRIVVLVMAIEPGLRPLDRAKPYGAQIAGPAVKAIVERTLGEYMAVPAADAVPAGDSGREETPR